MFTILETPIDPIMLRNSIASEANGAFVCFEGMIRADEIKNSRVNSLLYIADVPSCTLEGQKIIQETLAAFGITEAVCVQRIGALKVGEIAIWIGVWAPHRDEAFKACRHIIEEVKRRLLIWKKEFLNDGSSVWAYGSGTPVLS